MSELLDLATRCIRCGFCLESCPTYLETGLETESPRGRIYLARSAEEGHLPWSQEAVGRHLDLCIGCRACEPACPSGVEYGTILGLARQRLERERSSRAKLWLLRTISNPFLLGLGLRLPGKGLPGFLRHALTREKPEAWKPRARRLSSWPALTDSDVPPVSGEVYLLEGCVMRVLFPNVHEATRRLLRRVGLRVRARDAGCCGALHAHLGFLEVAARMASRIERDMPEHNPVVVNSAGCGSFLKEHAPPGMRARIKDVSEILCEHELFRALSSSQGLALRLAYQDACHLVHAQRIVDQPRRLLRAVPGLELVEIAEPALCCGSGGVYNLLQPRMARRLLERKWANIEATGSDIVATGNPGCHAWLQQAASERGSNVRVMHIVEVLESAFSGLPPAQPEIEAHRKRLIPS